MPVHRVPRDELGDAWSRIGRVEIINHVFMDDDEVVFLTTERHSVQHTVAEHRYGASS